MSRRVFDAWALMAWLEGQPAAFAVRRMLEQAASHEIPVVMSWINLGEVYYLLAKRRSPEAAEEFLSRLGSLPLEPQIPDRRTILEAARWKSRFPISYADAFAIETAREQQAVLVTGDPEMLVLRQEAIIDLEWIGT